MAEPKYSCESIIKVNGIKVKPLHHSEGQPGEKALCETR